MTNTVTNVYKVDDPDFCVTYTLPPERAVIAASEQYGNNCWYTWRYVDPAQYNGYKRTKYGHLCNGFWAKA